jgi:hypothetical protein
LKGGFRHNESLRIHLDHLPRESVHPGEVTIETVDAHEAINDLKLVDTLRKDQFG